MTTTMDSHIDLQNSAQYAQDNPVTEVPAAPASTTAQTRTPHPPSDIDAIARRVRRKQSDEPPLWKTFGNIPNIPIFSTWDMRKQCCEASVHRDIMAGISGSKKYGAYSIALSSSYKDNEDKGDVIVYTGTGGRERWSKTFPPKRLRVGPQTSDQSWDHHQNKALTVSFHTKNPIRVIRSFRCPSQYAPTKGYRYDGLYKVTAYWTAMGSNGKKICRCRLERLPGQPPIPLREVTISTYKRRRRGRLISESHLTREPSSSTSFYDALDGSDSHILDLSFSSSTGNRGESERVPSPLQRQAITETSGGSDFNMGGEGQLDVKEDLEPLPQHGTTLKPDALPRYRWDSKKQQLVQVPASSLNPEDLDVTGGQAEGSRVEDDAQTLVPSEDDHVDTITNGAETEYFSDSDRDVSLGA